ncbi:Zinc finger and BTB domain-containing protein 24, partial [Stegodyphus mimosarum]
MYTCEICGKVFTTKWRMLSHAECHSDVRSLYQCSQCSRNFTRRDNLRRHVMINHSI